MAEGCGLNERIYACRRTDDCCKRRRDYAEGIKTHLITPDTNEFHIEYLRFEKDTPLPEELQTLVHVAYKVDDLDKQLAENKVIVEPWMADEHTRIAFIMKDGILFELMEEVK